MSCLNFDYENKTNSVAFSIFAWLYEARKSERERNRESRVSYKVELNAHDIVISVRYFEWFDVLCLRVNFRRKKNIEKQKQQRNANDCETNWSSILYGCASNECEWNRLLEYDLRIKLFIFKSIHDIENWLKLFLWRNSSKWILLNETSVHEGEKYSCLHICVSCCCFRSFFFFLFLCYMSHTDQCQFWIFVYKAFSVFLFYFFLTIAKINNRVRSVF